MRRRFLFLVVLLAVLLFSVSSWGGTVQLPKTGQTTCYDLLGNVISCTDTGQDGELQKGVVWPSPRFTDNGDQTQTDNLTTLIWTKSANAPGPLACGSGTTMTWQGALNYVACLNTNNYLGHNDWRLPNINELESIFDKSGQDTSTWLNGQGFTNAQSEKYWSSTTMVTFPSGAWSFRGFGWGYVDYGKNNFLSVWPVRGGQGTSVICRTGQTLCYDSSGNVISCNGTGQDGELRKGVAWPSPRFTDNGDQSVTDNLTNLMWTKSAIAPGPLACASGTPMSWQGALDYVACLNTNNYLGHNDWRLPNSIEINTLFDFSQSNLPAGNPFDNAAGNFWWSSTSFAMDPSGAVITLMNGEVYSWLKSTNWGQYAWPVRDGQAGSSPSPVCGNGTVESGEQCDDNNLTGGDGCSATCTIESGYTCSGSPSTCSPNLVDMNDGTVYDKDTQLSWLKDANTAGTVMNWAQANTWASSLNAGNGFAGLSGWRLPTTAQPDGSCSDHFDPGGGFPIQGHAYNCANNEMSHLYYALGNTAYGPLTKTGPFTNLQPDGYWSGTEYAPNTVYAWNFYFDIGYQGNNYKDANFYASAVRPGARSVGSADTTPNAFTFTPQTGVALNTVFTSNTITVSGINAPAPISLSTSTGTYSVSSDGGSTWSAFSRTTPSTVNLNDRVKVRLTSSGAYSTTKDATIDIGGVNGTFSVTTKPSVNMPPTASRSISKSSWAVTLVDNSTDDAVLPANAIIVSWGDGSAVESGAAGSTFTHTYTVAGSYIIKHRVRDSGGLVTWSANKLVTVPVKYQVTGRVMMLNGTTPVSGTSVRLKVGSSVKKMTTTNASGNYTFMDVLPDSYTVEAVKSGLTFSSTPTANVTTSSVAVADIKATR
jgi:cysteine-rich repeat protein